MLRVLDFQSEQKKFDRVWEGWLFGTRSYQTRVREPNVEVARRRASISRKLKSISTEGKRVVAGAILYRELKHDVENKLELTQQELDLLIRTLEEADWTPETMDDAFDVIDWVCAADKVEK